MKTFTSIALFTLFVSSLAFAETACRVEGEASLNNFTIDFGSTSEIFPNDPSDAFKATDKFTKLGNELGTSTGTFEGTDLVFRGRPAVGGMVQGVYPSWDGTQVEVWTKIEFSTNWKPDGTEICTKHKTVFGKGRKCVEKAIQCSTTSFVVDLTTDAGTRRHYVKQFMNVNQANHSTIIMPHLVCNGPVNNFEVRVLDLNGGEVEFKVHKIFYGAGMNF